MGQKKCKQQIIKDKSENWQVKDDCLLSWVAFEERFLKD